MIWLTKSGKPTPRSSRKNEAPAGRYRPDGNALASLLTSLRAQADVVTRARGGEGVLREFGDMWLEATGKMEKLNKVKKKKD